MASSGLTFQTRSLFYMALRAAFLALIVFGMVNVLRAGAVPGDFLFFALVALVWMATTFLVGYSVRRLHWTDSWYDLLIVCMDVYFLVLALSLADGAAGMALLGMALYGFTVAVISSPLASLLAGLSGVAAYVTSFILAGVMPRPGMPLVLTVVSAAVLCGTAWRLCLPLILKALYFYLQNPNGMPAAPPVESASSGTPDDGSDAGTATENELARQIVEKDQELAALRTEKDKLAADLVKTNEELMKLFENSAPPADGGGGAELRGQLAAKDQELAALRTEKDKLAEELVKTNEELTRMFRV